MTILWRTLHLSGLPKQLSLRPLSLLPFRIGITSAIFQSFVKYSSEICLWTVTFFYHFSVSNIIKSHILRYSRFLPPNRSAKISALHKSWVLKDLIRVAMIWIALFFWWGTEQKLHSICSKPCLVYSEYMEEIYICFG